MSLITYLYTMSCSKFNLTNTGSTITTFNYQRCEDALWVYQAELNPNETKNIWLLDNTYSTAFGQYIVIDNYGPFPFTTPTRTPNVTPSPTPSQTAIINPTPTPTNTPTPTLPDEGFLLQEDYFMILQEDGFGIYIEPRQITQH